MPRRMTEVEKTRATIAWEVVVASIEKCALIYTPTIVRALVEQAGMSLQEAHQAIRDLLSLNLLEMHFDQNLEDVPKDDQRFVFPAPAWTNKSCFSPFPLPYMRQAQKPDKEMCGADHCGANAKDFKQKSLLLHEDPIDHWERKGGKWLPPYKDRINIDLESYEIIAVNSSGGKDSQAMLDAVFRECRRRGIEDRIHVYYADLGRAEWPGTSDIAEVQVRYYGVPFDAVKRPQGDLVQRIQDKGEWPGAQFRYCTSDLKRGQITRMFTRDTTPIFKALKEGGENRPVRVLNCLGIRAQEGSARSKAFPFKERSEDHGSSSVKQVDIWYPIFRWTNVDVWNTIARSGVPHHWAYDIGMPRLSCVFCIMGDRNSLMLGGLYNPELLDTYVEMEQSFKAMSQQVGRVELGKGVRASKFTANDSIEEIRDALERGERPSGEIDNQS